MSTTLPTGGELFRGCIVFPLMDNEEQVLSAVGYRYARRIRAWQQPVLRWQRPSLDDYLSHGLQRLDEVIHGKARH